MGLADFLVSKRQQRILAALLLHPERDYSMSELVALSGAGSGAGQNQINKLIAAQVVLEQRVGNQRRLRANSDFPLFQELRSICIKSFGLVEALRDALLPFEDKIQEAFVFGSVAKGTDTAESDIDILVIGTASLLDLNDRLGQCEELLGRHISLQFYEPGEWASSKSDSILADIASGPRLQVLPDAGQDTRDRKPAALERPEGGEA